MFRTLLPLLSLVGAGGTAVGISGMGTSQLASEVIPKLSPERYVAMVCFRVKPNRFNAFESVSNKYAALCSACTQRAGCLWLLAAGDGSQLASTLPHSRARPACLQLPTCLNCQSNDDTTCAANIGSTHPIDTSDRHVRSTHPIKTPDQNASATHPTAGVQLCRCGPRL